MKKNVIGIQQGETPGITEKTLLNALNQAYTELRSGEEGSVDIVLSLDDKSYNYVVIASVKSISTGIGGFGRKIDIWQNEKVFKQLGIGTVRLTKHMMIIQILDRAFNEVGNLYNLLGFKSEHVRLNSTYNYLVQMIDENFELKENYGRF